MDFGEEAGKGKASISGKGVRHATAGSHDTGRCEEQTDQREHKQADRSSLVVCCIIEYVEHRSCCRTDDGVDILQHEEKNAEEDEACEDTDSDARNHDSGSFNGWSWNFLNHMRHRVKTGETETSLKQ